MHKNPSILVIESAGIGIYEQIEKLNFQGFDLHKVSLEDAPKRFARIKPAIVFFHSTINNETKKNWLQFAPTENSKVYWVLCSSDVKPAELVESMRYGIRDYIDFPFQAGEFEALMDRFETWSLQCVETADDSPQRVLSIFSSKGGVGQTVLSVNLAVELARHISGRVLLIDCVLQHGNIAELLDLPTHYTLLDLVDDLGRMDYQLIENTLVRHESGLFVLPCPKNPEDGETIGSKQIEELLNVLSPLFHYIILDVGHEIQPVAMACLDRSDVVYVLTTAELPSLCNARGTLETFKKLGYEREKIKLVLNRNGIKGSIPETQVVMNLDYPISVKLGDDPELVLKSINQGRPWRKLSKKSSLTKDMHAWVEKVMAAKTVKTEVAHESA